MGRGTVRAFAVEDGALKWTRDPTPPGKTGAANAWAPMSVDEARDLVLVPTGSASPNFYGGLRPGDNKYANSVAALGASTGKLVWSFQVVHHDLWDYDVASRPELIDFNGKPAVGVLTKVGHYFALDRLTGINRSSCHGPVGALKNSRSCGMKVCLLRLAPKDL